LKTALKILAALAGLYALVAAGLYTAQDALVYPAGPSVPWPAGLTRVDVAWGGGTVPVLWLPDDGPALAWFHGNGDQLADVVPIGESLNRRGLAVGAIEYPGYGLAEGPGPTESHLIAAARAGMDRLRDLAGGDVACVGHSLGSGVAMAMAAEGRCTQLLLLSPFTSIADVAADRYPFLPVRLMLRDPWDSAARASRVRVPTWIVHGDADDVVDVSYGRRLAATIPNARYVERAGKGHVDVLDDETFDAIAAVLRTRGHAAGAR
jgi:pimeloyl-ACP methyl ester carboxylesterase